MTEMGGLGAKAPLLCAFFVAATMASIGLPGFGNFVGEFVIFASLGADPSTRWLLLPAAIGIVISAIYGLRAVANIFFGPPTASFQKKIDQEEVVDLHIHEKIPALILAAALLFIGVLPGVLSDPASTELSHLYPEAAELPQFDLSGHHEAEHGHKEEAH